MASEQQIQLLKKAIRNLKAAVDVLSEREREQLKDLIIKGQLSSEEELRAYLSRMIAARTRRREQEKKKIEEKTKAQRDAAREEGSPDSNADSESGLESQGGTGGRVGDQTGNKDDPAKITGKVICAKTRRPIPYVRVRVPGTSFSAETETAGVFIWEELPRGEQVNIEFTHKEFKSCLVQYRSTLDSEQHIVVKLAPRESKKKEKKPGSSPFDH